MKKLFEIFTWIDKEMEFDKWYRVESEEQKAKIIQIMDAELIPDCEFNADYSEFRKSLFANEIIIINKT